jgi:hypothetical protein
MAVEAKRGCGYRKVGGKYLVGGGVGFFCDRLPIELTVCPCCQSGIKQSRGWTWIDVALLVGGQHVLPVKSREHEGQLIHCECETFCPLCHNPKAIGKAGLLWIGEKFYPTPVHFDAEGVSLGISRRISAIPRDFKVGETWVLLAHPKTVPGKQTDSAAAEKYILEHKEEVAGLTSDEILAKFTYDVLRPGVFKVWRPSRIEQIFKESSRGSDEVAEVEKRGITPIFVPDDDKDHQGSVHDREEETAEVAE